MNVADLLAEVRRSGGFLAVDAGKLHYRGPRKGLTASLRKAISRHKGELLGLLSIGGRDEGPLPLPEEELREHTSEVRSYLTEQVPQDCYSGLPFPIGYEGLPMAQVEAAQAVNGSLGITDPVLSKYNVLTWVQGYYQDRGENRGAHYQAIEQEKQRIGKILERDGIGT